MTDNELRHAISCKKCLRCNQDLNHETVNHENGTTIFWMCGHCPSTLITDVYCLIVRRDT